jgi:4-amino-4-deoxy-L-arabinose transferase-like glycosyltransferase
VPIGRGADEWAHYWYAQFIADNGRLPASIAERETAGYKSDWPPLYHALAAAATGWIDTAGPPTFKYRADSIRRALVPATGPEAIVHTEDELFPWRQEILVWHLGRFLSIAFSVGTLLVTYLIALEVFANYELRITNYEFLTPSTLAIAATTVLAFNPRFLFTGMLFNYDSLTLLLSALFLLRALRAAGSCPSRWDFWVLGALAGLALVTKYLTLLLPLVIVLVAWLRVIRHSSLVTGHWLSVFGLAQFWKYLLQSALAYGLVSGWWFAYLIITFNEIEQYGPLLGTLAPLIRGDGSDRTVETLFAWLSGGQAPPPAYIQQQSYSAWQIITSFFTTLWGNPIAQPYPLTWFIVAMTVVMGLALIGLLIYLRFSIYEVRTSRQSFVIRYSSFVILLLTCLLPLPFMLMRLFGARDALEAVQGRHILFLAGPAFAVLLVWGLLSLVTRHSSLVTRFTLYGLPALLLTGSLGQLIFMATTYPPPAPVRTTPIASDQPSTVSLPGGAELVSYSLLPTPYSLQVELYWRGGDEFAPEDYQLELALLNGAGEPVSGWAGVQTQARYPTRAWEPGDTVRDSGWLPLVGLPAGEYTVQWRLLGSNGLLFDWKTLSEWSLVTRRSSLVTPFAVWRNGEFVSQIPTFIERETAQVTNYELRTTNYELTGPDGKTYPPATFGSGWANFIVQPHWPAGDYRLEPDGDVALRVGPSTRNFETPADMAAPLETSFEGKIKLLGYTLPTRRAQPGEGLPISLYWQAQAWLSEEFVIFTRLLDNQQVARGGYDRLARENYSTLLWAPGEVVADGFAVPVDPDAPDGVYWLSVGWYRQADGAAESLPLVDPATGQPSGQSAVLIGPIKVGGPPPGVVAELVEPENAVNAALGKQIELLGFNSKLKTQDLELTLFWQALRQPDADYTVFVHIRDAAGNVIAQKDQPLSGGVYPSSLWDAGEIIPDEVTVALDGVPQGAYEIVVGLYNFATGVRLPVEGAAEGTISLGAFEVSAQ